MTEDLKFKTIKDLVDHSGNKKRVALKLGISIRQVNRLISAYKAKGKAAFIHQNKGHLPVNHLPQFLTTQIVSLYLTKYQGFNFAHFKDLLADREEIKVSYATLYKLLLSHGFRSPKIQKATRRRLAKQAYIASHPNAQQEICEEAISYQVALEDAHPRRERAKYFGEEIQMDGSSLVWFGNKKATLHLSIDNATGLITGAYFDWQETLLGYYHVYKQILEAYGIPYCFKTDNRTIFNYERISQKSRNEEKDVLTQFGYACKQLGTNIITTSVSQAKGQIERANQTFQDRLTNEIKLEGIQTIDQANHYLIHKFIPRFNKQFAQDHTKFPSVFEMVLLFDTRTKPSK